MKWITFSLIVITIFFSGVGKKPEKIIIQTKIYVPQKPKKVYIVDPASENLMKDGGKYYYLEHTKTCGH